MSKEQRPAFIENPTKNIWQRFSSARWQTKLLILGGTALFLATA